MAQRSLFRRLLLGFVVSMLVIWVGVLAYINRETEADQANVTAVLNTSWVDKTLLATHSLAGQGAEVQRVGAAMAALRKDLDEKLGIASPNHTRIWQAGRLVYSNAVDPDGAMPQPGPCTARTVSGWLVCVQRDSTSDIVVESRQRILPGSMLSAAQAGVWLMPLVFCLPFLLLPAWFIVRIGLRPLRNIVAAIEARSDADLSALPASHYRELAPLVEAINSLMTRLSGRLAREQEFLSDAAHEMKTPLAVIQLNAHLLLEQVGRHAPAPLQQAGAGLREGIARASHVVHQLIAFERSGQDGAGQGVVDIDLRVLLRDCLAAATPLALARAIDIEFTADHPVLLPLQRESATALFDNVISNAVRYSPDGGRIDVSLVRDGNLVRVCVGDQGPGIAKQLRQQVFERFYRVPGQDINGSGLGLAIAERAAARNGASILLEDGADGIGLLVVILFMGNRD